MYSILTIALVVITFTQAIDWNKNNWAKDCDFKGNDLKIVHSSGDECRSRCTATPGCTHYTWVDTFISPAFPYILKKGLGVCYMKTNVVFKTYAISKKGTECGITSAEGYSTSKWDCCKPSCASNEASVRNPVVSCLPDDTQIHNNSNVEDGCSGGDAFTCGFYQPWAENDYVSNGFATVRLPGKYDADLCCMCFKLKFTSGPVVGKEMIVQVINTGEAVTEGNYFDLLIPGTGDSSSNGCSTQWGHHYNKWWQDNVDFGRVQSEEECSRLPPYLIKGCIWRFKWFQNADNPTFDFVEVRCNPRLYARSGCERHDAGHYIIQK